MQSISDVISSLGSTERGLSSDHANALLKKYGTNKLAESRVDSIATIFIRQFRSPLIYILVSASVIVFLMDEIIDGVVILAILLFNAIVGTIQEGKAQNTLLALKRFTETKATVLRDNKEVIIPDLEVVPGDVLVLQEGERIPADARVILSHNLKVDEATLTGESEPVHKTSDPLPQETSSIQYKNIVYKATHIVSGSARAIVVATGPDTVIGSIANKIATIDTDIPLKNNIKYLSRLIILTVGLVSVFVFTLGISFGKSVAEMFATVVSLAVSIVPEGLPVVVTLILAMGVWRMGKQNALVKKLQAVEALGQANVIAVDKTGTITKNELVIQRVYTGEKMFSVDGVGYEPVGATFLDNKNINAVDYPELLFAAKVASFCADARVMYLEENRQWRVSGDPTEAAMEVLAQKLGFSADALDRDAPIIEEIPFDYKLKYHAVLRHTEGKNLLCVIGAPEVVLGLSETVLVNGRQKKLDDAYRKKLESVFYQMSQDGLRVIAFAVDRSAGKTLTPECVSKLSFAGFYGMKDAIRSEARFAIQKAMAAGVRVVMITGDHKITAQAIAKEIGIWKTNDAVLLGSEIEQMTQEELIKKLDSVSVFARVNPEHKMTIINAYRAKGIVIAMTGDGVNDAPSLVAADLGVAMGTIGTEVAKEASDVVLLDDNLESIVCAIEEGRSIYKTIKKVILYLFSTSMGEVITITGALALSFPLPILPVQIIWLNFVTDGFLTVALASEPKEKHLLRGSFEKPKKYIVDKPMGRRMFFMSIIMAIGTLYVFTHYYEVDLTKAWTMSLTTLAAFQWFNAWNCRSDRKSIFSENPFSNMFLVGSTIVVVLLQYVALYTPFMQKVLRTAPIDSSDWIFLLSVAFSIVLAEEIRKWFARRTTKTPPSTEEDHQRRKRG